MDTKVAELYAKVIAAHLAKTDTPLSWMAAHRARTDTMKLLNEVRKLSSPEENRWNFRWVIFTLALVALSAPIWVIYREGDPPDGLLALASTSVGALAGFLTPYARAREAKQNGAQPDPELHQTGSTGAERRG